MMNKIIFLSFLILCSCTTNLFDELAEKDTPEAIFFEAKRKINDQDYDAAILLLNSLDPSYLTDRERVPVHASAYAGRCGLVFLDLLTSVQNPGTSTILGLLMAAFNNSDANDVSDCITAEDILRDDIGDSTVRNANENLFNAFISLSKIAAILSFTSDTDNDDVADGTYDVCTTIPDNLVRHVGAGIGSTLLSLAAVGTSYVDDAIADVNTLCAQDPNLNVFCTADDPSAFGANEVQALRWAIASSDYGIDACGGNDFSNCAIANPVCP